VYRVWLYCAIRSLHARCILCTLHAVTHDAFVSGCNSFRHRQVSTRRNSRLLRPSLWQHIFDSRCSAVAKLLQKAFLPPQWPSSMPPGVRYAMIGLFYEREGGEELSVQWKPPGRCPFTSSHFFKPDAPHCSSEHAEIHSSLYCNARASMNGGNWVGSVACCGISPCRKIELNCFRRSQSLPILASFSE
jgi:hypothetical protein